MAVTVSIQVQFPIKSGLWWGSYGIHNTSGRFTTANELNQVLQLLLTNVFSYSALNYIFHVFQQKCRQRSLYYDLAAELITTKIVFTVQWATFFTFFDRNVGKEVYMMTWPHKTRYSVRTWRCDDEIYRVLNRLTWNRALNVTKVLEFVLGTGVVKAKLIQVNLKVR